MKNAELGIYVYGLVAEGELAAVPDLAGIDPAHGVERVTQGEVSALVSRVDLDQFDEQPLREHLADMAWVEQTARRHQLVLDAVLAQCTPIPMRLCTLYTNEDALREMLEREQDNLSSALHELSGKLEWGVQVFASGKRTAAASAVPGSASGTAYLQNKLAARTADEHQLADIERVLEQLHAELCDIAVACRLGVPQRPEVSVRDAPMVLNAFYMVASEQRESFRMRVAELHDELAAQGIELQLTGPWAPYNFVTATLGGAE